MDGCDTEISNNDTLLILEITEQTHHLCQGSASLKVMGAQCKSQPPAPDWLEPVRATFFASHLKSRGTQRTRIQTFSICFIVKDVVVLMMSSPGVQV